MVMKLWKEPFNHIEAPSALEIPAIEYSFITKLAPGDQPAEELEVGDIVSRLKTEIVESKKRIPASSFQNNPTTTYYLDWAIDAKQSQAALEDLDSMSASKQLAKLMAAFLDRDDRQCCGTAMRQIIVLMDCLISLIESSRKKLNSLDSTLRLLVYEESRDASESVLDSAVIVYQLVSLISREEKLIEKYTLLRSKLLEIERLNERLLRRLWRYRPRNKS